MSPLWSRQGVRHIIKKGEEQLSFLEDRLGLAEHYEKLTDAIELLANVRGKLARGAVDPDEVSQQIKAAEDIIINK